MARKRASKVLRRCSSPPTIAPRLRSSSWACLVLPPGLWLGCSKCVLHVGFAEELHIGCRGSVFGFGRRLARGPRSRRRRRRVWAYERGSHATVWSPIGHTLTMPPSGWTFSRGPVLPVPTLMRVWSWGQGLAIALGSALRGTIGVASPGGVFGPMYRWPMVCGPRVVRCGFVPERPWLARRGLLRPRRTLQRPLVKLPWCIQIVQRRLGRRGHIWHVSLMSWAPWQGDGFVDA